MRIFAEAATQLPDHLAFTVQPPAYCTVSLPWRQPVSFSGQCAPAGVVHNELRCESGPQPPNWPVQLSTRLLCLVALPLAHSEVLAYDAMQSLNIPLSTTNLQVDTLFRTDIFGPKESPESSKKGSSTPNSNPDNESKKAGTSSTDIHSNAGGGTRSSTRIAGLAKDKGEGISGISGKP